MTHNFSTANDDFRLFSNSSSASLCHRWPILGSLSDSRLLNPKNDNKDKTIARTAFLALFMDKVGVAEVADVITDRTISR